MATAIDTTGFVDLLPLLVEYIRIRPPGLPFQLPPTPPPEPVIPEDTGKKKSKRKSSPPAPVVAPVPEGPPPDKYEMDKFFQQSKEIKDLISRIHTYHTNLDTSYKNFLQSTNEREQEKSEQFIEDIINFTNKQSLATKSKLDEMHDDNQRLSTIEVKGSGDMRMRTLHYESLVRQFAEAIRQFQVVQKNFQEKQRGQLINTYLIVRPYATQEELDRLIDSTGNIVLTRTDILKLGEKGDLAKHLEDLRRRRTSVLNIEEGLKVLNQMFIDMETMINEQGETLDSIEDSIEAVEDFIEDAATTLNAADGLQKQIRKKKCSIF